jgi:hypothetical protein
VSYEDVLLNKNSLALGAALISIRSEKQTQRLLTQITPLKNRIAEKLAPINASTSLEVQPITNGFNRIFENIVSNTENDIEEGNFVAASLGINQLEQIESFIEPLVSFLQTYDGQVQALLNSLKEMEDTTSDLVKSLEDAKRLLGD